MALLRSFVSAIYPRFNDFKHAGLLAALVLLGMLAGFVGVLAAGLQPSPVTNRQVGWTNEMGDWEDHKITIARIHDDPYTNVSFGTTRSVDMCIAYADGVRLDVNSLSIHRMPCSLFPDEIMADVGFPKHVRWCPWSKVPLEFQNNYLNMKSSLSTKDKDALVEPWDIVHAKQNENVPSYTCAFKDVDMFGMELTKEGLKYVDEHCDEDEYEEHMRSTQAEPLMPGDPLPEVMSPCGIGNEFYWKSFDYPLQGPSSSRLWFRLVISYTIIETQLIYPSVSTVLGAAFGYLSVIQLVATVVLGGLLVGCGVAKPLEEKKSAIGAVQHLLTKPSPYEIEQQVKMLQAASTTLAPDAPAAAPMESGEVQVEVARA